jgi:hypothetical protein
MSDEPFDTARHFDLYTRDGEARFRWRLTDRGVVIEDDALGLIRHGRWTRAPYNRIVSITLNSGNAGRSGTIANCTIQLSNGTRVVISNVNDRGLPDGSHDGPYRLFIETLHTKLLEIGAASSMRFISGYSPVRINVLIVISIVAGLMFVALPLVLLLLTREIKMLIALVFSGGLLWSVARIIRVNQPGTYRPSRPPDFVQ